jgi:hypothetical protein
MPDTTPDEPIKPIDDATTIQPVPEVPAPLASDFSPQPLPNQPLSSQPLPPAPDVLADVHHPLGSSYDPMPLQGQIDDSRNWMGVVALIFGILGGSIIAIVFGILGLNAVKRGKATNRGMNVWGIVLGSIWLVIGIIAAIAFVVFFADAASKTAAAGDCYISTVVTEDEFLDTKPLVIACSGITNGQVYYVADYDGMYTPSDPEFQEDLFAFCTSDLALTNVDQDVASEYFVENYVPNASTWDEDPHTVICAVSNESGPVDPGAVLND